MDKIVELIPNWSKEVFGFNQGTLVVLLGLVILVFKLRIISMMTIPKIFSSLCEKSPVAKQALQGSSKALGTAIGAAILWQGSAALSTSDVAMMSLGLRVRLASQGQGAIGITAYRVRVARRRYK